MGRYLLEVTRNNATTLPEGYTQHAKEVAERIKALDSSISRPAAERYPETIYLQQVSGVGPITSLYFVLKVGNPGRFQRTRDIGAFLGLCPKRDQSGETDKELRISKCGDRYLRRLLELPSHGSRESFKLVQGADARAA